MSSDPQTCDVCEKEEEPILLVEIVQRILNEFDYKFAWKDDSRQSAA
jgi:hypothetical protein